MSREKYAVFVAVLRLDNGGECVTLKKSSDGFTLAVIFCSRVGRKIQLGHRKSLQ